MLPPSVYRLSFLQHVNLRVVILRVEGL